MDGVELLDYKMTVRLSNTNQIDDPYPTTCPTIRDLTKSYYGKAEHRFTSPDYERIPPHNPTNQIHVVGYEYCCLVPLPMSRRSMAYLISSFPSFLDALD